MSMDPRLERRRAAYAHHGRTTRSRGRCASTPEAASNPLHFGRETSMDEQEWLVATHEAGHAVAAHMLGRPVRLVSILPTEECLGMTILGGGEAHRADRENLLLPTVLRP